MQLVFDCKRRKQNFAMVTHNFVHLVAVLFVELVPVHEIQVNIVGGSLLMVCIVGATKGFFTFPNEFSSEKPLHKTTVFEVLGGVIGV